MSAERSPEHTARQLSAQAPVLVGELKALHIRAEIARLGLTQDEKRRLLGFRYGKQRVRDLTVVQANDFLGFLRKNVERVEQNAARAQPPLFAMPPAGRPDPDRFTR